MTNCKDNAYTYWSIQYRLFVYKCDVQCIYAVESTSKKPIKKNTTSVLHCRLNLVHIKQTKKTWRLKIYRQAKRTHRQIGGQTDRQDMYTTNLSMWIRDSCAICLDSLMSWLITLTLQEEHMYMQLNRKEEKKDEPFKENGGMEHDTCN